MNYGQLKTAILNHSHKENYASDVALFISEGEGKIASMLDGYILSDILTDADKVAPNIYSLANGVSMMRRVYYLRNLTQVDESTADAHKDASRVLMYTMRDASIFVAGNTPPAAEVSVTYYGMPAPLAAEDDTNALLNEYPQLYIQAAQIFVFAKSQNWQAMNQMTSEVERLIREINRRTREKLGGAQSATPYNTTFRSSY